MIHLWSRRDSVLVAVILLIGVAAYLLTKSPAIGALLASIQAASDGVVAAIWLWRGDSVRSRASVCALFQLSAACWQGAAKALMMVILIAVVANYYGREPDMEHFGATMIALIVGVILTTLIGLVAMALAVRSGVRVWVHPKLRNEYHSDLSLLGKRVPFRRFNYAIFVVGTSLAFPVTVFPTLLMILFLSDPGHENIPGTIACFAMLIVGPLIMIAVYAWLSSRIIARAPAECWPAV